MTPEYRIKLASGRERAEARSLLQPFPEYRDSDFPRLAAESNRVWVALEKKSGKVVASGGLEFGTQGIFTLSYSHVAADHRGHNLQRRLISARVQYARRKGGVKVETYAWAENTPSLVNLLKSGFVPTAHVGGFVSVELSL